MSSKVAASEPFVCERGCGRKVDVLGVTHIYKAMATDTAGSVSVWEDIIPPGAGVPPHVHEHEDEAFYVLSGEIQVEFEGEPAFRRIEAGDFFFGARHRTHSYRNVSNQPARLLVLCTPSRGLDRMFVELEAATAGGTPDIGELAGITARYGVTIKPPAV
jgi:quercetin dioxygenase-like cupin family protein